MLSGPGPALRLSQRWSDAPKRSQALPNIPRRRQEIPKTPKTPPRSPQDPQDDPKRTPRRIQNRDSGASKTTKRHNAFVGFSKIQPLPFVLCSVLIKNGLKISSRSLQERSKMPNNCQHGPNMGSKRGAKIGSRGLEIWSRGV